MRPWLPRPRADILASLHLLTPPWTREVSFPCRHDTCGSRRGGVEGERRVVIQVPVLNAARQELRARARGGRADEDGIQVEVDAGCRSRAHVNAILVGHIGPRSRRRARRGAGTSRPTAPGRSRAWWTTMTHAWLLPTGQQLLRENACPGSWASQRRADRASAGERTGPRLATPADPWPGPVAVLHVSIPSARAGAGCSGCSGGLAVVPSWYALGSRAGRGPGRRGIGAGPGCRVGPGLVSQRRAFCFWRDPPGLR